MLISRKVTEVSEISHVNLRAEWKELTKPINRSNSSLVQDVAPRQSYIIHTSYIHHFSGAPRGAFQQPVYNKCKVWWLRVLARPLQAVHHVFLSETLSCALS